MLVAFETHPIQYHAPVFRSLQEEHGVPVTAIYGSDFSLSGYEDKGFGEKFAWDVNLLSGYQSIFLSRVDNGGARSVEKVSAKGLGRTLEKTSARAVLVCGYGHSFHRTGLRLARRTRLPILYRAEARDHGHSRGLARRVVRDAVLRVLYRQCAGLLYIGEESRRHYRRLGVSDDRLTFSPYCVDLSEMTCDESARNHLRPQTRQALGIAPSNIVLLFSGKLIAVKRPDLLLHAIKMLRRELRQEISAVFLGSGEMKGVLQNLSLQEPSLSVVFPGFKNQRELSPYYHAADLLVLPSKSETWGLVVNEALHHGLPCVVSRAVGCAPDLIEPGESGEIFDTHSLESLAQSIERALRLVDRAEIREICRQKAAGYNVTRAAAGIAQAYRSVIN